MDVERTPHLAELGVAVLVDREARLVAVDDRLDHWQAVEAIAAVMPEIPGDAIEHWVERVLPTRPPLSMTVPLVDGALALADPAPPAPPVLAPAVVTPPRPRPAPNRATRRRKRHKRPTRPARMVARTGSALGATGVGALAAMVALQPSVSSAAAFDDPIFLRVASMAEIDCHPLRDEPLRAQCVTAGGRSVEAEALLGADSITYSFTGLGASRAVVKVFAHERALARWVEGINNDARFPNLVVGDRVAVYGSDPEAIDPFLPAVSDPSVAAGVAPMALTAEDVAPVILRASYAMGLIPDELAEAMLDADETLGPLARSSTPAAARAVAMAIVTGDPRLSSSVELSSANPWSTEPEPVVEAPRVVVVPVEPTPPPAEPAEPVEPVAVEEPAPPAEPVEPEPTPPPADKVEEPGRVLPEPVDRVVEVVPAEPVDRVVEVVPLPLPEPVEELLDELVEVVPLPLPEPVDEPVEVDEVDEVDEPERGRRGRPCGRVRAAIHDQLVEERAPLLDVDELRAAARDRVRGAAEPQPSGSR